MNSFSVESDSGSSSPAEQRSEPCPTRRIAWDGFSFQVPKNWELTLYKYRKKKAARIEIEDEYTVRLELEWIRPEKAVDYEKILERYEQSTKKLALKAEQKDIIKDLPEEWAATCYTLKSTEKCAGKAGLAVEKHQLTSVFYMPKSRDFFAYFLLHNSLYDTENHAELVRILVRSFTPHTGPLVPWELFDLSFEVPREFVLLNTQFDIGAKLMVFHWQQRRFYLWSFSCADMFLKEKGSVEEWVAGYLNGFSHLRGPVFLPDKKGKITWKRRRRHFLGHRDEIIRWCFLYKIRCRHDRENNRVLAWIFSYRKPEDLQLIPPALRFGADLFA